ncbi:uncharacterized protein LOC120349804 [Nilaparvata lugens]|uniref:uncharacterized protein LOC120349804 n=1 Tax=Nilaparvata lugens TaxID=108931 RepID=UPI00193EAEDD|nr:uncharacterized protein LOC120349804 [Nilaparvata lugens]
MMDFVASLPPEVTEEIFSYLSVRDLMVCEAVCRGWRLAAKNLRLWKKQEDKFEKWLLPNSMCDIIPGSFHDTSHSLAALLPEDDSQFNRLKFFLCQRNFLKHNWSHGIYTKNTLRVKDFFQYIEIDVFYPSKSPYDCQFYPFVGLFKDDSYAFLLMRLDDKPKIVGTLCTIESRHSIDRICVMRDCLVWFSGLEVKYFSLTVDFDKSEVCSLGNFEVEDEDCVRMLTMDSCSIVAAVCSTARVWCKKTLSLRFDIDPDPHEFNELEIHLTNCWLYDGYLILVYHSILKFYNIQNDIPILENQFCVSGCIDHIHCNNGTVFLRYFDQGFKVIEVRNKKTLSIKFSRSSKHELLYYLTHEAGNEYISFGNFHTRKIELRKISKSEYYNLTNFNDAPNYVFDSIALIRGKRSLEVWDWRERTNLYNVDSMDMHNALIVHVSTARVVIVGSFCEFQIYSFS